LDGRQGSKPRSEELPRAGPHHWTSCGTACRSQGTHLNADNAVAISAMVLVGSYTFACGARTDTFCNDCTHICRILETFWASWVQLVHSSRAQLSLLRGPTGQTQSRRCLEPGGGVLKARGLWS